MGRKGFKLIEGGRRWSKPDAYGVPPRARKTRWGAFAGLWLGAIGGGLAIGYLMHLDSKGEAEAVETVAAASVEAPASAPAQEAKVARPAPAPIVERITEAVAPPPSRRFGFCHEGGGTNCVVDGDTIYMDGVKIRIAGIDAPETHDYRCASEKARGDAATQRLIALVNSGEVSLSSIDRDEDSYGRKLRNVAVDGRDVGEVLVSEGLARPYGRGRRSWC